MSDKKSARGLGCLLGALLLIALPAIVVVAVIFGVGPRLFNDTTVTLDDGETGTASIALPPTDGQINVSFDQQRATVSSATEGRYSQFPNEGDTILRFASCPFPQGCVLVLNLEDSGANEIDIEYPNGDSEYLDDITIEYSDDDVLESTSASPSQEPSDELTRDDVDCSAQGLGSDNQFTFVAAHYVVNGELGELCFGFDNPTVRDAWQELATITPPDQLADLALFGGFDTSEGPDDEITAAFVNAIDDEGTEFQLSINIDDYASDADEAALTMAHEFAHVFTLVETQIDRTVFEADDCDTYYNGDGCFLEESIIAEWVRVFWGDGLIDEIDPFEAPSNADGEERCEQNPSFFGTYAASDPEEDFAETFSAYVYQLEPDTAAQQVKLDWIDDQPGLAEFRDRAIAAGRGPLRNNFDVCG